MRLLHTTTLEVVHFLESGRHTTQLSSEINDHSTLAVPRYAILSHTWEDGELTLQDMSGDMEAVKEKAGFKKIKSSCELARKDGLDYIWIDTCCIDKTNSTELFEAINSMFSWYKNAWICYVYLADAFGPSAVYLYPRKLRQDVLRWYKRGWTLQELVAPKNVAFYSMYWQPLGAKTDHMLEIAQATGIDPATLAGGEDLEDHLARISVARRMGWAAYRETTRPEDMAYCMLGIFGISMPVLYGEGDKAFLRLQEEILKVTDDQSLFAWREDDSLDYYREDYGDSFQRWGLLARAPADFRVSQSVARFRDTRSQRPQIQTTNRGIRTTFLMCRDQSYQSGELYLAVLDCQIGHIPGVFAGIRLKRMSNEDEFVRVDTPQLFLFCRADDNRRHDLNGFDQTQEQDELFDLRLRTSHKDWKPQTVFVKQDFPSSLPPGFWLVPPPADVRERGPGGRVVIEDVHPKQHWDPETWTVQPTKIDYRKGISAAFVIAHGSEKFVLAAGALPSHTGLQPWCKILPPFVSEGLQKYAEMASSLPDDWSLERGLTATIDRKFVYGQEMFVIQIGF